MAGRSADEEAAARSIVKRAVRLPFAHQHRLVARLARDRRVPWFTRLPLVALLLYLAMPLDIIPDFMPVIGHLDDLLIAGSARARRPPPHDAPRPPSPRRACSAFARAEVFARWPRSRKTLPVSRRERG
jgi:hypothetical protein